ncbi:MAG: aldo/keto reductase [Candidatus Hodarchaeales archaeon]|jgi:aryl-alcohol dehydrogenase-like predicted oxidoreductase
MNKRVLGRSGIEVSPLGMGCFPIGGPFWGKNGRVLAYGNVNDKESVKTIHKAVELGINFFDTADVYGAGHSEKILGTALSEYKEDFVIATKFANEFNEKTKIVEKKNVDPDYINKAVNDSLKRLQVDVIDVYQLHDSSHDMNSALKVRDNLEDLVSEGKIKFYGWSTDDPDRAIIFAEGKHCTSIQYCLSLQFTNDKMIELCNNYDLASIIRSPLQSGTLTGKRTNDTILPENHMLHGVDFTMDKFKLINQKLDQLKQILTEDGRSIIQAALAYLWTTSETTIPIPGARTVEQIEENARTLEFGSLPSDLVKQIDILFSDIRKDLPSVLNPRKS